MKKLKGVITAMTTCFDENDQVDVNGMQELTEFLIESGVNCLYPCGTTGEMHLLTVEERKLIAETVVNAAAGRVTVYIQVGAMTTKDTIELAKHACEILVSQKHFQFIFMVYHSVQVMTLVHTSPRNVQSVQKTLSVSNIAIRICIESASI